MTSEAAAQKTASTAIEAKPPVIRPGKTTVLEKSAGRKSMGRTIWQAGTSPRIISEGVTPKAPLSSRKKDMKEKAAAPARVMKTIARYLSVFPERTIL